MMLDEREHPVTDQEICAIYWQAPEGFSPAYYVGSDGVTRIEKTTKSGMYANIPYVRVWAGDSALAEFCQHQLTAIFFADRPTQKETGE